MYFICLDLLGSIEYWQAFFNILIYVFDSKGSLFPVLSKKAFSGNIAGGEQYLYFISDEIKYLKRHPTYIKNEMI